MAAKRRAAAKKKKASPKKKTAVKKKAVAKKKAAVKKKASAKKKTAVKKKTTTKKKSVTKKTAVTEAEKAVTIVSDTGREAEIPSDRELQQLAMRWRYILTRRSRWQRSSRKDMRTAAFEAVREMIPVRKIKSILGKANVVEVRIPFHSEDIGWEARVAPWEFLISSSAAGVDNRNSPAIVRYLKTPNKVEPVATKQKVLYVQCAPGVLSDYFDFSGEREILKLLFGDSVRTCINPTLAELRHAVSRFKPTVIHLAGIDNNQAKELLKELDKLPKDWQELNRDGVALSSDRPDMEPGLILTDAESLAAVLNVGSGPLNLVVANVYHSASRICALAVAEGAGLALGFQDTIGDSLAESMLREFYTHWLESRDALTSFTGALDAARLSGGLAGTGAVLWSAESLLDGSAARIGKARERREAERETVLCLGDEFSKWLEVDIKVRSRLNYSLLHNDSASGGIFERFRIRKQKEGILKEVTIEVVLYLGSETHPYTSQLTLTKFLTDIAPRVKVPLTSPVFRTVSEPMHTSLRVRVAVAGTTVHEETYRVTLLPVDEWKDNETDGVWLPSFVLPRDPAVASIIGRAANHLITLTDDRDRALDGYQSIDPSDPENSEPVDQQVRAVWAAVVGDFGIRYTNPPPSYSPMGQRLRRPTEIVRDKLGTCIDLALLLAACLEYIDIYPVVFLLDGHAFVGYWRSQDRYDEFMWGNQVDIAEDTMRESTGSSEQLAPWVLPANNYEDVVNEVNKGFLVPIETVGITDHGSFRDSIADGKDNLSDPDEFHSLIDIVLARSEFITPLPIID